MPYPISSINPQSPSGLMGGRKAVSPIVVHDKFTGANGTNLNGRTPDTVNNGNAWSVTAGAFDIQNNAANSEGTTAGHCIIQTNKANCKITCDMSLITDQTYGQSIGFRFVDANNRWTLTIVPYDSTVGLNEITNGTVTPIDTKIVAGMNTGTHTIVITLNGASISYTIDGANAVSINSSSHQTATIHGLRSSGIANQIWDNFKVESLP